MYVCMYVRMYVCMHVCRAYVCINSESNITLRGTFTFCDRRDSET